MKIEPKNTSYALKRIFNIRKTKNTIDLKNSFSILNNTEKLNTRFDAEIYKVTFSIEKPHKIITYDLFLTANELIGEEEIDQLQHSLGISLSGDGTQFEILDYQTDFTIQFDQESSSFIDSDEVRNGLIIFRR